jgi:hypothetical protein
MNPFHEYRWQDHVVRPGWWKLDFLLAAVSICVISATFEADGGSDRALMSSDRPRAAPCDSGERAYQAEPADLSNEGSPLTGRCAQHGGARWTPPSDHRESGLNGPSS